MYSLFLALQKLDLNEDKLELEYLSALQKLIQHQLSFTFSFKGESILLLTHERDSKVLYSSIFEIMSWKLELWQHHGYHEK